MAFSAAKNHCLQRRNSFHIPTSIESTYSKLLLDSQGLISAWHCLNELGVIGVFLPLGLSNVHFRHTNKCIWRPCCSPAQDTKQEQPLPQSTQFKAPLMCWDKNAAELVFIQRLDLKNWNSREESQQLEKCWGRCCSRLGSKACQCHLFRHTGLSELILWI